MSKNNRMLLPLRGGLLAACVLLATSAQADMTVSIGLNISSYPQMVVVPGYPVYYYPQGNANYFFYDGQYWVYQNDIWYASNWYDGPWDEVDPDEVPLYVLRVPVRYYRVPPPYFAGWGYDAPPRWGEHWGRGWEDHHRDWDRWDYHSAPRPAPLPSYQRNYYGDHYPHDAQQQQQLRVQNYHYQPREVVSQRVMEHRPTGHNLPGQQQQYPQQEPRQSQRESQLPQWQHGGQQPPRQDGGQQHPQNQWQHAPQTAQPGQYGPPPVQAHGQVQYGQPPQERQPSQERHQQQRSQQRQPSSDRGEAAPQQGWGQQQPQQAQHGEQQQRAPQQHGGWQQPAQTGGGQQPFHGQQAAPQPQQQQQRPQQQQNKPSGHGQQHEGEHEHDHEQH